MNCAACAGKDQATLVACNEWHAYLRYQALLPFLEESNLDLQIQTTVIEGGSEIDTPVHGDASSAAYTRKIR